jgi:hypothetical protein
VLDFLQLHALMWCLGVNWPLPSAFLDIHQLTLVSTLDFTRLIGYNGTPVDAGFVFLLLFACIIPLVFCVAAFLIQRRVYSDYNSQVTGSGVAGTPHRVSIVRFEQVRKMRGV